MRSSIIISLAVSVLLHVNLAQATGVTMRSTCTPVLSGENSPVIIFKTTTMSAPGGPASNSGSVTVAGAEYKLLKNGQYEQGLTVNSIPLKYPSGSISSSLAFITVKPGKSTVSPVKEVLYNCVSKSGL